MSLYRINLDWVAYTRHNEQTLMSGISNEFGVHGEGVNSMHPLVPVEATDRICTKHGATQHTHADDNNQEQCWAHDYFAWTDSPCNMVDAWTDGV